MANDVYENVSVSSLLSRWTVSDTLNKENLRLRAYRNTATRTLVIAVRGTANWQDTVNADLIGIGLGGGVLGLRMNDALTFASDAAFGARDVWLTGHSLGGAYVQLLAAMMDVPGMTFNAPGATAMLNQMSGNPLVAAAGGLGSGAMQLLATAIGAKAGGTAIDFITKAAAGAGGFAYGAVANYRGNMDPVSKIGVHVGMPVVTIPLASQMPHPHSMVPLIQALETRRGT